MTNDQPTFTYDRKQPGDPIRSRDWNAAMQAIVELGAALRRKAGNLLTGPLTIQGFLEVLGTIKATKFVGDGSGLTGLPGADGQDWRNLSPSNAQRVGEWRAPGGVVNAVYVAGKYAYAAVDGQGICILDITDPAHPQLIGAGGFASIAPQGVAIGGRYAYLVTRDTGLDIFDIANAALPQPVGAVRIEATPQAIALAGPYVYLATTDGGLAIIDSSDPTKPQEVGIDMRSLGPVRRLTIAGRYAYLAKEEGLQIVDLSELHEPKPFAPLTALGGVQAVYVAGCYAYVATSANGLQIVDVGDPASPRVIGQGVASLGALQDVTVAGHYAYVAAGEAGLQIIDIRDPTQPQVVGSGVGGIGVAQTVSIAGQYAYIAAGEAGLQIIDLQGPVLFAAHIGAIAANTLSVSENGDIGNLLSVRNGLNVGPAGIKSDGPLQAESVTVPGAVTAASFVGDGSGLTGLQGGSSPWTNKADGAGIYYSAGGVTIGATNKGATLQILNKNQDASAGNTLVLGSTDKSHLKLGYNANDSWIQSGSAKPLLINPLGGNVGIGTPDPGSYKLKVESGDTYLDGALTVTGALEGNGELRAPFFKAGQGNTRRVPAAGWYRIAEHPGHWANAEFTLRDTSATRGRSSLTFRIGSNMNQAESISFTLLNHSRYYYTTFTRLRLLLHPNDGSHYVEVYVDPGGYPEEVSYSIYDNLHINAPHSYGWQSVNWEAVTAVPADYIVNEFDLDKLFSVGDNNERFSIARGGNIGIGKPEPQAKLDVDGYILEKLDIVPVGEREDWPSDDHPLLLYFKTKLHGQPAGTMMRALTDNPKWKDYYWVAWVNGANEVRVWRNDDKDTGILAG